MRQNKYRIVSRARRTCQSYFARRVYVGFGNLVKASTAPNYSAAAVGYADIFLRINRADSEVIGSDCAQVNILVGAGVKQIARQLHIERLILRANRAVAANQH